MSKNLFQKRQNLIKQIRRTQGNIALEQKRQDFIKKYQTQHIPQTHLTFEQVQQEIFNSFKNIFTIEAHLKILEHLLSYPEQAANSNRIVNYIISLLQKSRDQRLVKRIQDLLQRFVLKQQNIQSYAVLNILPLLQNVQFLYIWLYICEVNDLDMKQQALLSFEKLMKKINLVQADIEHLQCISQILRKFMYHTKVQPHKCYFAIDIITNILKLNTNSLIYCNLVYALVKFCNSSVDIKSMLKTQLSIILYSEIQKRNQENQIITSMYFLSNLFLKGGSILNFILEQFGNVTVLVLKKLISATEPKVKKNCMFALSNAIAERQEDVKYLLVNGFVQYLKQLYQQSSYQLKKQVMQILYVMMVTIQKQQTCKYLLQKNIMKEISNFVQICEQPDLKIKCLCMINIILAMARESQFSLSEGAKGQFQSQLKAYDVEGIVQRCSNDPGQKIRALSTQMFNCYFDRSQMTE